MIAIFALSLAPAFTQDFEVESKPLQWSELATDVFDRTWTLPAQPRTSRDLLAEMRKLSELQFTIDLEEGPKQLRFGDLVEMSSTLEKLARIDWFNQLNQKAPQLMRDWGSGLSELLLDDELFSADWDPSKDYGRDGLLIADDWEFSDEYGAPWNQLKVNVGFTQAAALFRADLATIKAVENDYRKYPDNIGSEYEQINPKRDSFFRGQTPAGDPFSTLALEFRCDLPFPYTSYQCDLRILNRLNSDGIVQTDIYSTSEDFYYLAGRDVFLPIENSKKRSVGFIVVRHFGFDLVRVPDKPKHRLEGVRSSLGNLKRNSERRTLEDVKSFADPRQAIANFRVLGRN